MKVADSVASVIESSKDFPSPFSNVLVIVDESDEEYVPWDQGYLIYKDNRGTSILNRIQKICGTYSLSVLSDARLVQVVIREALVAFASAVGDEAFVAGLKTSHVTKNVVELDMSIALLEERLAGMEQCIKELERNNDTLDSFRTNDDETENVLKDFEKHVRSLQDKLSEQSTQLHDKDNSSGGYR